MRGAWVTGHAGWCHTELGVLSGYWRRVTATGCCGPGIARIVIVMPGPCWSFTALAGGVSLDG